MVAGGPDQAKALLAAPPMLAANTPDAAPSDVAPPPVAPAETPLPLTSSGPKPMATAENVPSAAPSTDTAPPPVEPMRAGAVAVPGAINGIGATAPPPVVATNPHQKEFERLTAVPLPSSDPRAHTDQDTGRPGYEQIHNPILRGLATAGNILASRVVPGIGKFVPGTSAYHNQLVANEKGALGEEQAGAKSAAEVAQEAANTARTQEETKHLGETPPPTITTDRGIMGWNPATHAYDIPFGAQAGAPKEARIEYDKQGDPIGMWDDKGKFHSATDPSLPQDVRDALVKAKPKFPPDTVHVMPNGDVVAVYPHPVTGEPQAKVLAHTDPKVETEAVKLKKNGVEHTVLVQKSGKEAGKEIADLGETGEKAPVTNIVQQDFQKAQKGRELLDKAEGAYRAATQSAGSLSDFVKAAQSGNKVAAEAIPLEGALSITTAQGVHRINRNEIDQVAGAGSLFDRIMGRVGKWTAGQPIPADVEKDFSDLAAILKKGAYQTYKDAHTSAVKRYGLTNEEPLPESGGKVYSQADIDAAVAAGHGNAKDIESAFKAKGYVKQ